MPIYEYRCEKCHALFEQVQKITDDPIETCIKCGGPVHRIISHSTFILKGTGWYATDYASKEVKRAKKHEKKQVETDSVAAEKSTDSDTSKNKTKETKEAKETKETKKNTDTKAA